MPDSIRLLGLSGSLRASSVNTALLHLAGGMAPAGVALEVADISDFPLFSQDLEDRGMPHPVRRVREAMRAADGVLIATPEYNYSVPGVLKNALDWISRPQSDSVTAGKPVAILGAGGRLGTARAQYHLREVLLGLDMRAVSRPELFIVRAWEVLDAEGRLRDPATGESLQALMSALLSEVARSRLRLVHAE